MDTLKKIQSVNDLFNFFEMAGSGLRYLVENDHSFEHFYSEYIGEFRPITPGEFCLFLTKSSYGQIALAYQGIYNQCAEPDNEYKIQESYFEALVSIRALHLWFNNFRYDQMEQVFIDFPEFGSKFMNKKEQGFAMEIVKAEGLFELFFSAQEELQKKLMQMAINTCGKEVAENIRFNMSFFD